MTDGAHMRIESDLPTGVTYPQVAIEVTTADHRHTRAPLEYETWDNATVPGSTRVKSYDAAGACVVITLDNLLLMEMAFGCIPDERP